MKTQVLTPEKMGIETCVQALRDGQLVAFPTETVYGLGAHAFNESAVLNVFKVKNRPHFDPLIVHAAHPGDVHVGRSDFSFCTYLDSLGITNLMEASSALRAHVELLARKFWPGPLTMVLPRSSKISDLITSGLDTVAVRIPNHQATLQLLTQFGAPLVGPSANRFGRISPTTANDVLAELADLIPFVLDGGRASVGVESTVIFPTASGEIFLLRPGGVSRESIASLLNVSVGRRSDLKAELAPGQLKTHYAPKKMLFLTERPFEWMTDEDWSQLRLQIQAHMGGSLTMIGVLAFSGEVKFLQGLVRENLGVPSVIKILSPTGDFNEAAHLLFGSLRVLDQSPADAIIAEPPPTIEGLGLAIFDRLTKAAGPK